MEIVLTILIDNSVIYSIGMNSLKLSGGMKCLIFENKLAQEAIEILTHLSNFILVGRGNSSDRSSIYYR